MIARIQAELEGVFQAARAAHEAATHDEAKPENQYDTRGLEASYLAGAQTQRAAELQAHLAAFRTLELPERGAKDPIELGALVELELAGTLARRSFYFMVPRGGGTSVTFEGRSILALVPSSPMGEALLGRKSGEDIEVEIQGGTRAYHIVRVG